jgi:anti-anti-sigma factor
MHHSTFVRIEPLRRPPRAALRALVRAAARVRALPGFRQWRTFRAMDPSNALLVMVEWEAEHEPGDEALRRIAEPLRSREEHWRVRVGKVERLHAAFDRRLGGGFCPASLLRVASRSRAGILPDDDFALRALAAPGSVRHYGAANAAGTLSVCRVDFETEDGLWHFLESPLRREWSRHAARCGEQETWAINLPRLEYGLTGCSEVAFSPAPAAAERTYLSVQLELSEACDRALLRLFGSVDGRGSVHCERTVRSLLDEGCRILEIDLTGLTHISAEALHMLTRMGRELKHRGGRFVVIDTQERVERVTRMRHLQATVMS